MSKPDEPANILASQLPQLRELLGRAAAEAVNTAAGSIRDLREWCDRSETAARAEPLEYGCSCLFDARMQLIDEVRTLLPPVHESGSPDP